MILFGKGQNRMINQQYTRSWKRLVFKNSWVFFFSYFCFLLHFNFPPLIFSRQRLLVMISFDILRRTLARGWAELIMHVKYHRPKCRFGHTSHFIGYRSVICRTMKLITRSDFTLFSHSTLKLLWILASGP